MPQYVIYLRKSRADLEAESHGEGETLLRHEKALLELAKKLQLTIKSIYREIVSGETITARPVMQQLLTEVEENRWAGVLVMEIERLARGDTIDQGIVAQAFKYSNTKIITPVKIYDPTNEFDEEYFEFGLFMSRREYKTINRRIQRGRIASVKEGKFISSTAPYGYNRVKIENGKGYKLAIYPEQADVIQMIFRWYTMGDIQEDRTYIKMGTSGIAKKLNELGIKPKIKDTWSRSSITDILKNPVYTGKIRWAFRKEVVSFHNNEVKKSRPYSKNYLLVNGLHEPIIDNDTYRKAQSILAEHEHSPVPGNHTLKNPLSGIIFCGKCGARMTRLSASKKTPYDRITCPNRACNNISAPLYLVEDVIIAALRKWLSDYKLVSETDFTHGPGSKFTEEKESIIRKLYKQLENLKDQKERICTLLEQGVYSAALFTERNNKLSVRIKDLTNSIQTLEYELKCLTKAPQRISYDIPVKKNFLDLYCELDSAVVRNEILKSMIKKVTYTKSEPNTKGNKDNANFNLEIYPKVCKLYL